MTNHSLYKVPRQNRSACDEGLAFTWAFTRRCADVVWQLPVLSSTAQRSTCPVCLRALLHTKPPPLTLLPVSVLLPVMNAHAHATMHGSARCPGRFFAEMELALMLQLVLLQLNLTPTPWQQQHQQPPAAEAAAASVMQEDRTQPRRQQQQEQGQQTLVDLAQPRPQGWLQRMAVFGLGSCGGSSKQQQQWWSSGVATAGGDVPSDVRLPRSDLRRLVGFKVPSESWCVSVEPRQLSQAPVCDAAGTGAES